MTGTEVRLDAGGTWWCRPYLGTDSRGRQVRPYRSFPSARSREEAQALADSWLSTLSADGSPTGGRLRDLLADYVDARETCGASPNSVRTWRLFAGYVDARMGTALARDVTAADMARLERDLARPRAEGGQGLARNSVRGVHMFLRAAFSHLCRSGVVDTNPMLSVDPPSRESHEAAVVDEWDFAALDSALSAELGPGGADGASLRRAACALAAWLSLRTGVRCGEACALRRRDVRPAQGCVHVAGTVIEQRGRAPWRRDVTKGRKCRNVAVTADVTAAVSALEAAQDAALGRLGPDAPVVTADGSFMRPTAVSRSFSSLRRRLGMPAAVTFHSLRHTHAAWCLSAGVDLKTLSERLGHADEATTLRTYAHLLPGRDALAARAFARAADEARGMCQPGVSAVPGAGPPRPAPAQPGGVAAPPRAGGGADKK